MKKFAFLLTALSFAFFANQAHAGPPGGAPGAGMQTASNFAWGVGLGALTTLGVVIGLTASSAPKGPTTFSHS